MDPKPPRNPEPPKPPKPPKPPEGTSERVSSTPQGEAVPANNETGLDGNTSEI